MEREIVHRRGGTFGLANMRKQRKGKHIVLHIRQLFVSLSESFNPGSPGDFFRMLCILYFDICEGKTQEYEEADIEEEKGEMKTMYCEQGVRHIKT
jgi:hypothetical protein